MARWNYTLHDYSFFKNCLQPHHMTRADAIEKEWSAVQVLAVALVSHMPLGLY